jgi:hypothetical protein
MNRQEAVDKVNAALEPFGQAIDELRQDGWSVTVEASNNKLKVSLSRTEQDQVDMNMKR